MLPDLPRADLLENSLFTYICVTMHKVEDYNCIFNLDFHTRLCSVAVVNTAGYHHAYLHPAPIRATPLPPALETKDLPSRNQSDPMIPFVLHVLSPYLFPSTPSSHPPDAP